MVNSGRSIVYGLIVMALAVAGAAGQVPSVFIDGNPETEGYSPAPDHLIEGEEILIAVVAADVRNVHSYSVKCAYDNNVVTFNGASAALSARTGTFLESCRGKLAAFIAVPGEGTVEIAAAQSGSDSTVTVNGSGVLGYLSFIAKKKGNPRIAVKMARMVDCTGRSTWPEIK